MYGRYRWYIYRFNRRIKKMLLVKENLEIELRESIVNQLTNSFTLENDSSASDEVRVHELRKAVKRSRALLRLLKPALDESFFYDIDEMLGKSARLLADQREATVNLRTFINLIHSSADSLPQELKNTILDGLSQKIDHSYNSLPNDFADQLHASLLLLKQVKDKMEKIPLQHIESNNILLLIKNTYQKTAKLYDDARYSLETEIIHKWRRYTKHLLFQLKLSPFHRNLGTRKMISLLEDLSDTLGNEHDLAIMEEYLQENFNLGKDEQQKIHLIVSKERSKLQKYAFAMGQKLFA